MYRYCSSREGRIFEGTCHGVVRSAQKMFKGDPTQSVKELLDEIKTEAVRGGLSGNLTYLMPALTALLVKLSDAADVRAKAMERWTKIIAWLTAVLALLTLAVVWDALEKHFLR